MRACGLDSLKDCFLHDLGQVRSDYDGSDLIQVAGSLSKGLLQWYQSTKLQALRNLSIVE